MKHDPYGEIGDRGGGIGNGGRGGHRSEDYIVQSVDAVFVDGATPAA